MLKRSQHSLFRSTPKLFFLSSSRILYARKEEEDRAKTWKFPSFVNNFLEKTAPAHLRGTRVAEEKQVQDKIDESVKRQKEQEELLAKKKSAATQAAKVSYTAEERGFVKGGKTRAKVDFSSLS